ncbi:MAG: phage portal protein [Ectothiorhodospiraceae bacterium]|nr:phage portal protein [Ectothiorhodospiraceae bacterium]MCH8502911.1 phage portal protein [Ectothiorhodospiraceae bacterium]
MAKPHIRLKTNNTLPLQAAAYTAGDPAERTMRNWYPTNGSADGDLLPELGLIRPRSRDMFRNNGIASGGLQTLGDNIVGSVLRLSAKPHARLLGWEEDDAEEWANGTEAQFDSYANTTECDAARRDNLLGLTLLMLRGSFMNGDAIAIPEWQPLPGHRWATRFQIVEADRLCNPPGQANNAYWREGVRVDEFGAAVSYGIRRQHPGDRYGLMGALDRFQWREIPAFTPHGLPRVIHLYDKDRAGLSRGKPILSSVMKEFRLAGKYSDAELETALATAMVAAFLESDLSPEAASALFGAGAPGDKNPDDVWRAQLNGFQAQLQGSAIIPIPTGGRVHAFSPNRPNNAFDAFMESTLRHIAVGWNIPYEVLLKDFSKTNYSSARAALLEAWRYFKGRQRWLKDHWLRPVYELWMDEAIARRRLGRVTTPEYRADRYAYSRARWVFAGRGWVDPVKEAQAARIRMDLGISTLEDECAEQGTDWEEQLKQRARERRRMQEEGLLDAYSNTPVIPVSGDEARNQEAANG